LKKTVCFLLAALCAAMCLTGCTSGSSGGSQSSSPSPSQSASSSSSSGSSSSGSSSSSGDEDKKGNVVLSGSTALQPLLTQAVDSFKSRQKFTGAITVNGGSSLQGLEDVLSGAVDIGMSDLSPQQAGMDDAGFTDHQVAVVLIGVAVSQDVAEDIQEISVSDLRGIYTGTITDWQQVAGWKGGSLPVEAIYHPPGSGVRLIFETYGISAGLTDEQMGALPNFTRITSSAYLEKALESGRGSVGYAAYPYCSKLSLLKVDGIEPSYDNVYAGKYKLWCVQHLYTRGSPAGGALALIEFVTGKDFEKTITANGYGIISEMKVSR
jgi:phosphate transport system substrate-binding protein